MALFQSRRLALAGVRPVQALGDGPGERARDRADLLSWDGGASWVLIDATASDACVNPHDLDATATDPAEVARTIARGCRGDYAIAWWNGQKRVLVLIRDAMGLRPLYYAHVPPRVAFATNLATLRTILPGLNCVDPVFIAHMLCLDTEVGTRTGWRDLRSVPAGGYVVVSADQAQARTGRWWWPELDSDPPRPRDGNWSGALRERLLSAVADRLPEDPDAVLASFLSGGLDSSSIVGALRAVTRRRGITSPIQTLSFRFPGLQGREQRLSDETSYQDAVNDFVQATPHVIRGDLLSPLHDLDRFLIAISEPWVAPNRYLHHAGLRVAEELGAAVVFDGIDGDSAIGDGVERFEDLVRSFRWLQLLKEARKFARNAPSGGYTVKRVLREYSLPALQPASWRRRRDVEQGQQVLRSRMQLLSPELRSRDDVQRSLRARSLLPEKNPYSIVHRHALGLRLCIFDLVTTLVQRCAMAEGLRVAFPFFDRGLLELSLAAPLDQKLRNGWPRYILREAIAGLVPDEVRWRRRKAYLGAQFYRGLMTTDRPFARALLNRSESALEPYVDIDKLRVAVVDLFERENRSRAMPMLSVITLARWLELRDEGAV